MKHQPPYVQLVTERPGIIRCARALAARERACIVADNRARRSEICQMEMPDIERTEQLRENLMR
jgi:hypothetical protein